MPRWINTRSPEQLDIDARALFTKVFGNDPEGVWAAPGRVNVIGDHVDYAGGISIPFALQQNTAVAVRRRNDALLNLVSLIPGAQEPARFSIALDQVGPLNPSTWAGYVVGTIWAGVQSGVIPQCDGLDIAIVSDVPVGSGLSSSAALECSIGVAAYELAVGRTPDAAARAGLVEAAIRAENEVVGASTGGLDQRASIFGEEGKALVIDFHTDQFRLVPFDLESRDLVLLIADTNAPHTLNDGQYASRRGVTDEVAHALGGEAATIRSVSSDGDILDRTRDWATANGKDVDVVVRRVKHIVEETERTAEAATALDAGNFDRFRELMKDSHISLRDQYEVSTPELDSAFDAAGQYGARMTGGGFGGSVITLVAADRVEEVATAIADAAQRQGYPEPTFVVASPGQGARRLS
ncbi:galactokinase [Corynebacterium rouxii]|uniref:galactokinase n=1 Tax=Corynebacterium rouxii TaxID=2719119 RepID=UPI00313F1757